MRVLIACAPRRFTRPFLRNVGGGLGRREREVQQRPPSTGTQAAKGRAPGAEEPARNRSTLPAADTLYPTASQCVG